MMKKGEHFSKGVRVQRMKKDPHYQEKIVLITGAGSGIGRETALAFARKGSRVIVSDKNKDDGFETLKLMENEGNETMFIPCDVSKSYEVSRLMETIEKEFKGLDYAFNNAGIESSSHLVHEFDEDEWDRIINVNLKGIWLCLKYELQIMMKKKQGSIVNNSSIAGLIGLVNMSPYVASKHAVIGLTKTAALDYASMGIRINAICPGAIKTPMLDRFLKGDEEQLLNQIPMNRFGRPHEISDAVLWLCSPESSYLTGTSLTIDGGWTAST